MTYQPSHPLSHDPEALRLYLRARAFGRNPGRAPLDSAIRYLGEAVRIDSGFTAAYEALAIAHIAVTFFGDMPSSATIEQAKAHAATVLSHGAGSVRAHMALAGASHWYDFDHEQAEAHFHAGMAADDGHAPIHNWYAEFLLAMLRFDEAIEAGRSAETRDPGWLEVDTVRGNVYLYSGRIDEAIATYRRALETEPNHGISRYFLGQAYLAAGRYDDAVAELRGADDRMGHVPFSRAGLAHALARHGGRDEAETILADMLQRRRDGYYPAFAIAVVRMGLGEEEAALDWLEQAFDERLMGYYPPNVDLTWRPLRQHPRFQDLLRRLRLPAS